MVASAKVNFCGDCWSNTFLGLIEGDLRLKVNLTFPKDKLFNCKSTSRQGNQSKNNRSLVF